MVGVPTLGATPLEFLALSPGGQFGSFLHVPTVGLTKMADPGPFHLPRFPKTGPVNWQSKRELH